MDEVQQVVGGIVMRAGELLLGKRAATRRWYPNLWDIFGGHVEAGEDLEAALVRELQEELGITLTGIASLEVLHMPASPEHAAFEYHVYLVTDWTGTIHNRSPDEHEEIGWFPFEHVEQLELAAPEYHQLFRALRQSST
ncbi:MAG: NUDIX hydrolase [Herpetosiphonaceae bacterium]|nr:NUDIX hydrolase [Herpetosiphonaceae bacterium]